MLCAVVTCVCTYSQRFWIVPSKRLTIAFSCVQCLKIEVESSRAHFSVSLPSFLGMGRSMPLLKRQLPKEKDVSHDPNETTSYPQSSRRFRAREALVVVVVS